VQLFCFMSTNKFTTNNNPTLAAVSNADGESVVFLYADPTTHGLVVSGSGGGGGAVTIADGADVTLGAIADATVTAGSTGTVSGKLRQISSDIATSNTLMATSANQTNGTQQTKITDGTNIANVLKSDGTAAGQNAELVAGTYLSVPFTTTTAQAVGTTDAGNYRSVSVQILTQGTSSTITFQGSNDNTNWSPVAMTNISNVGANIPITNTGAAGSIVSASLPFRYFRLNVTGISAGTTSGTIVFSTLPPSSTTVVSSQNGTWTVGSNSATGSAVPANAFYMGVKNSVGSLVGVITPATAGDSNTADTSLNVGVGLFNNVTYDRTRNNITGVVIAAGATATNAGVSTTTYNASKAVIIVNVSAFTSGSLTVTVNGITSSGYSYPILVSTALAATGTTPLRIFPGATPSANAVANDMVPRTLQVVTAVTGTLTYGIDYELSV
jgi:hypothetical protein